LKTLGQAATVTLAGVPIGSGIYRRSGTLGTIQRSDSGGEAVQEVTTGGVCSCRRGLETHETALVRWAQLVNLPQHDLFLSREELEVEAYRRQEKRIAYRR